MIESRLVKNIRIKVKQVFPRCRVVKHSDRFRRGDPDLEITFPRSDAYGRTNVVGVLHVEVKRPEESVLGYLQQQQIDEINRITGKHGGCWAIVAESVEEVIETLIEMGCVR